MRPRRLTILHFRNETPFLRMLLAYILGIAWQLYWPAALLIPAGLLVVGTLFTVLHAYIKKFSGSYRSRWVGGFALQATFFALGLLLTGLRTEKNYPAHISTGSDKPAIYIAKLIKPCSEKTNGYKSVAEIIAGQNGSTNQVCSGKILVYFAGDSLSAKLAYGDLFCFAAVPAGVPPPRNPGEFDYKRFLAFHQVYEQVFLSSGRWHPLGTNDGNPLIRAAYRVRDLFTGILRDQIKGEREFAVAAALIIGYDDAVDQELMQAFSASGALHVLSVSGMHVGLIYQGLLMAFGFMTRRKWSRYLLDAFLLAFIWFYAFITGFTPSVARSALMISIVILSRWQHGSSNVFNTMVVTALGLLLYNPFYLTEVGFQLSFLAVWGILFFHPKIYACWETSNWLMSRTWELTSISLSAQLMTFPLGLLYFHQFPNFFLVSNLLVIPLSGLIIYLGIAVLVFSFMPLVGSWIAEAASLLISLLNHTVLLVESLPGSVFDRVSISVAETWMIYLMLAAGTGLLVNRRGNYLVIFLFLSAIFLSSRLQKRWQEEKQSAFIVYHVPGKKAIDLVDGRKHVFISDSSFIQNRASLLFHVAHYWWDLGMKEDSLLAVDSLSEVGDTKTGAWMMNRNFIYFRDKKICLADKSFVNNFRLQGSGTKPKLKTDYLVLSEDAVWNIGSLTGFMEFKKLIFDASNSKSRLRKWKEQCLESGLSYYSVPDSGAFIADFR